MKETMTIHKALAELKTIQKRIESEIDSAKFVATNKHSSSKINGVAVADFNAAAKDAYKSIRSLINRRNAIKQAIIKSNALTTVTIAGKEYTVAEAIDMKSMGVLNLQSLMGHLSSQMEVARRNAERENGEKMDRRADDYVKSLYENADMKNMSEEVKKVREEFVASQTIDVIDPIGADAVMKELRDYSDSFLTEVDAALSVSNALTTIEVEYETL